jgi:hypothetical protein
LRQTHSAALSAPRESAGAAFRIRGFALRFGPALGGFLLRGPLLLGRFVGSGQDSSLLGDYEQCFPFHWKRSLAGHEGDDIPAHVSKKKKFLGKPRKLKIILNKEKQSYILV